MYKGKILSTYYQDRYLNVFSDKHLNFFLTQLYIDSLSLLDANPILKRERLRDFKNQHHLMSDWSLDIFMYFLYYVYPLRPTWESVNSAKLTSKHPGIAFPVNQKPEWVDLRIWNGPQNSSSTKWKKPKGKGGNYESKSKRNKLIGNRGEKLVIDLEKERLIHAGKPDLAQKVSLAENDSYGYDIVSYETDGRERNIEVKSTTRGVGDANFYLTSNELDVAINNPNYFLYIVFEIESLNPKIWPIPNPFSSQNKEIKLEPVSYEVKVQVSK